MVALANVSINDSWDIWRTRTNQIIIKLDQLETSDGASFTKANDANIVASQAFDKANSANVLAFNTGIGANAFASATIAGANTTVGTGANAFTSATIAGANSAVGTGANAFTSATIAGANSAVGTGANAFASATIAGANTAVGSGANSFASATIAGANTAVGTGANSVAIAAFARANAGISILPDTINATRYITFINAISGSVSTLNVSTSQLTFNPSSNTLSTNNAYLLASLGVGTTPSGTVGDIRATSDITAYYSSDVSLKTNIENIPNALDKIMNIRGVGFDWKDSYIDARGGEDGYFVRKHDVGVIAQEIEKVLPEVVATRDNGIKAVRYEKLVALLIEAVKELNEKIEKK
jgi:hypothetical protein